MSPSEIVGRGFQTLISGYDEGSDGVINSNGTVVQQQRKPGIYIHTTDMGYSGRGYFVWSQQAKLVARDAHAGDKVIRLICRHCKNEQVTDFLCSLASGWFLTRTLRLLYHRPTHRINVVSSMFLTVPCDTGRRCKSSHQLTLVAEDSLVIIVTTPRLIIYWYTE